MQISRSVVIGSQKLDPDVLRRHRERLELSQARLAELIGVSRQTISNWERSPEDGGGAPLMMAYALVGLYLARNDLPGAMSLFRQGELFPDDVGPVERVG